MRKVGLETGSLYHVFNRGVNRSSIFSDKSDYRRFLEAAFHYKYSLKKFTENRFDMQLTEGTKEPDRVEIICYCLMPNHFHFLVKQLGDGGITSYFRQLSNSYSHYFNTKYGRVGPLYQGRFKAVLVENDEQLMHVTRYIHLNPIVSGLCANLEDYSWSSYRHFTEGENDALCNSSLVLGMFKSAKEYQVFVNNQIEYGKSLEKIKHASIDM